jgi:uncharacterized membrane protein YkoI
MRKKITAAIVAIATLGALGGVAASSGATGSAASGGGSRLDDGAALLGQAKISEPQAISAAQGAADGALNEVDLEQYAGRLVFNVDVGSSDVKVDAGSGKVLDVAHDD